MLQTFRKYTGLMFVVLILLFIGLVFFASPNQGLLSGTKVITVHGRGFTAQEYVRFAENPSRLLMSLFTSRRGTGLQGYLGNVGGVGGTKQATDDFLINRVALQQAMSEFGLYSSNAEIETFLKETTFWDGTSFNQQAYDDFKKEGLQPLGMTVKDLHEIIGEVIAYQKLEDILGAGVAGSREVVLADHLSPQQRLSYQLISFPVTKYQAAQMPTDEEVKAKWEAEKGNYLTEPMRSISYILAQPDWKALAAEKEKKETEAEALKKVEGEKEGDDNKEDEKPGEDKQPKLDEKPETKLDPLERKVAINKLGNQMDDVIYDGVAAGKDLAELAKKIGQEMKTTGLLEQGKLPVELSGVLRDEIGGLQEKIFVGSIDRPKVYGLGEDKWVYYQIDEIKDAEELTFEAAKEQVKQDLIKEMAMKEMKAEAEAKHEALTKALDEGKSFADATKELKINPLVRKDVTSSGRGALSAEYFNGATVNPGKLSEVFTDDDKTLGITRSYFLFLENREVYESGSNLDTVIDTMLENARTRLQHAVVRNWFFQRRSKAEIQYAESN